MSLRCLSVTVLAGVSAVSTLTAQVAVERTVSGRIVDSVSGRAVRGTVAFFDGQRTELFAGRDGRFEIEHVSAGDTLLIVRSIGYVPTQVVVPPSGAVVVDLGTVMVRPVATRLDQIAVEAEEVRTYPHLEDFYRRRQQGVAGEFITREDIEKTGTRTTSVLLGRSPKIHMDCPHDAVKSGTENCAARDRRGMIGGYRRLDNAVSGCEKELFVDGRLSTLAVDEIAVEQIAGVEIYAGPATTPANFGQRRCGVIAIWTKGAGRN